MFNRMRNNQMIDTYNKKELLFKSKEEQEQSKKELAGEAEFNIDFRSQAMLELEERDFKRQVLIQKCRKLSKLIDAKGQLRLQ